MSKYFLDTNILIYSIDADAADKRAIAQRLIADHYDTLVLSTQILQEFHVCAVKKLGLAPFQSRELIVAWQNIETVQVTPNRINQAIDLQISYQLSFWDALVLTAAKSANCDILFTEDLNHGQSINGVQIQNPFLAGC